MNLTINNTAFGTDVQTACNSYKWIDGNTYTASNNSAIHTIVGGATNGCDSIVSMDLTILESTSSSEYVSECASYLWPATGESYTESGTYTAILTNVAGCDSVITLNLIINNVVTTTTVDGATITADELDAIYQWFNCDENSIIEGEINQSFTATTNGDYGVIIGKNECVDTSTCVSIISLGIVENTFGKSIQFYPNPTDRKVNINLDAEYAEIQINVRNITGKLIKNETYYKVKDIEFELNVEQGIYFVEIYSESGKAILELIKR